MNYINAQKEILGEYLKENRVVFGRIKDNVVYGNGYKLYITPEDKVGINFKSYINQDILERILNDSDKKEVYLSNECVKSGKSVLRCFKNDDVDIYVDEKLLKNFDVPNCKFKGDKAVNGVFVYENEVMVGCVMPVRLKNS